MNQWNANKRVMRYLGGKSELGITVSRYSIEQKFEAYVNANWAEEQANRRSVTEYILSLQGSCVSWQSIKQNKAALSTAEDGYVVISMCCPSIGRLFNPLIELKDQVPPVQVWGEIQPSMKWAENGYM